MYATAIASSFFFFIVIPVTVIMAFVTASIAKEKGHAAFSWFFYALFFMPFAFPHALLVKPTPAAQAIYDNQVARIKSSINNNKTCMNCYETINQSAKTCPHCGDNVETTKKITGLHARA